MCIRKLLNKLFLLYTDILIMAIQYYAMGARGKRVKTERHNNLKNKSLDQLVLEYYYTGCCSTYHVALYLILV